MQAVSAMATYILGQPAPGIFLWLPSLAWPEVEPPVQPPPYFSCISMCLSSDTLDRVLGDKRHFVQAELEVRPAEEPCAVAMMDYADCVGEDLLQASREAIENAVHSACLQGEGCTALSPVDYLIPPFYPSCWSLSHNLGHTRVHSALMLHS